MDTLATITAESFRVGTQLFLRDFAEAGLIAFKIMGFVVVPLMIVSIVFMMWWDSDEKRRGRGVGDSGPK